MTPMMQQYFETKNQYKDHIVFYRLGDFYEMFFDDAIIASRELELTLTGRDCGEAERAPMCGVPYHSAESYIGKLIEKGYKVAICEQVERPSEAQGLVKREVVRIVTPGTLIESELLPSAKNNYICSVYYDSSRCGICIADISTALIRATSFSTSDAELRMMNETAVYLPREVIINVAESVLPRFAEFVSRRCNALLNANVSEKFEYESNLLLVRKQFGNNLKPEMLEDRALVGSIGAMLQYVAETQKSDIAYIKDITIYDNDSYLEIDANTRRNLELCETMRSKEKKGSLLWVLDDTRTSPGARLLRQWIEQPLINTNAITERQSAVIELNGDYMLRENIRDMLSSILDLERLMTKVVFGTANGKDLRSICDAVKILPEIKKQLESCKSRELSKIYKELDCLEDVYSVIDGAISEDPPFTIREGGIIKNGFDNDVDHLRSISKKGTNWKEELAEKEKAETGIRNLKVGYNKIFGYYIEVSNSNRSLVPERYIRKQTLVNGERYITEELKELEATVLGAQDRLYTLEYEIFQRVREKVAAENTRIRTAAKLLSLIDVYQSLASVAAKNRYVCPEISADDRIIIKDGRHPVVEKFVRDEYFVPNDTTLDTSANRVMLITGPNMAGKSTYMRQVALITIMAQMGSFVPAREALIGIADQIFTRVGASDDLASGQSTFMLEMNEVAYILKNATRRSLIIYDEVGRGTSTFDGMSIARAVVEFTNSKKIGARTLFATHYHELTVLENEFDGIINYNIAAKKRNGNIAFLRKIVRGSTDDSYGIEVANLAGLPSEVIKRAKEILANIEKSQKEVASGNTAAISSSNEHQSEMSFEDCLREQVIEELIAKDINTLSPYEAMSFLFDLQRRLK